MNLDIADTRVNAGSALWFLPLTLGSGADAANLAGVGTVLKISVVNDAVFEMPIGTASAKSEFVTVGLSNGVTAEIPKQTKVIDGAGAVKAASGDAALHKFTANIAANNLAAIKAVQALENAVGDGYVLAVSPLGDTNTAGFAYMIGKITGTLKIELGGNSHKPTQIVFNGLDSAVEATEDFTHTIINTAITSITQPGTGVALHPATAGATYAIEAGDIDADKLLSGKVLLKP